MVTLRRLFVLALAVPTCVAAGVRLVEILSQEATLDRVVDAVVLVDILLAAALAILLTMAERTNRAASALSVGLAALGTAFATVPWSPTLTLPDDRFGILLTLGLMVVGGTGILRFLVDFPSPPSDDRLSLWIEEAEALNQRQVGGLGWAGMRIKGARGRRQYEVLVRLAASPRLPRACAGLVGGTLAVGYLGSLLTQPLGNVLLVGCMLVFVVPIVLLIAGAAAWINLMPARYLTSDEGEQRRLRWINVGVQIGVISMLTLIGTGGMLLLTPWSSVGTVAASLGQPAFLLSALAGIAIGTFWEGGLDPRLAVSRTKVLSLLAFAATAVFATLETVLSTWLTAAAGLPDFWASVFAGVGLALAVGPMHRWLRRRISWTNQAGDDHATEDGLT